jgi:hypothetical protein
MSGGKEISGNSNDVYLYVDVVVRSLKKVIGRWREFDLQVGTSGWDVSGGGVVEWVGRMRLN